MQYDALDAAIVKAIKDGKRQFYDIKTVVGELAKPHSLRGDYFRVVDRRLQALRKRGRIAYIQREWYVA